MSVDILGTCCDQCRSMVQYNFTSTETRRLVRTDSPGRPPRRPQLLNYVPWETFLLNLYWYMYAVYKRYRLIQCTHDYSHTIVYMHTKIMKIQVNVIIWQLPMSTLDGFQNIFKRHYNKQQQLDTYHRKLHSTIYRLCMHLHSATEGLLCNVKPYKDYNFKTWLSSVV